MNKQRCSWPESNSNMIAYHDTEWGVPLHDDHLLFEFMLLDTFQAGLSWAIVLNKRAAFRDAFDQFDFHKIAFYKQEKIEELVRNEAIIRNKQKIKAAITNAQCFLKIIDENGSFDSYIWQFVNHNTIVNHRQTNSQIPVSSPESDAMSKVLKQRGFKFVGTTICYAFMQAAGMVNDHVITCYRHAQLSGKC